MRSLVLYRYFMHLLSEKQRPHVYAQCVHKRTVMVSQHHLVGQNYKGPINFLMLVQWLANSCMLSGQWAFCAIEKYILCGAYHQPPPPPHTELCNMLDLST